MVWQSARCRQENLCSTSSTGQYVGGHANVWAWISRRRDGLVKPLAELGSPALEKILLTAQMLTLFAIPKNFRGHIATIQRNAIASWTRLIPRPEILLFGSEEGTAEIAGELGLRHFPEVERNEFGTPLLGDLFRQAEQHASTPVLGYVNADIILTTDFISTLDRVHPQFEKFMMVGRRWDLDWNQPLDFSQSGWAESIRANALRD